ncbi:MAG: isopentenyl phosphate kinase family protein [Anaerolineales bacterium]|nr:isopentenyl phosphate kinase family protein [Anaerolineales bacterium]
MLLFLKLGGSLITDKTQPRTPRPATLARLMREIASACAARPDLQIVLGHGSGSFGHVEGKKYGTRNGVHTAEEWRGFADVQHVAALLNRLVVDAAREAGLPVVNFPPSASVVARDTVIEQMALAPLENALAHGLLPVVQGDVAVDLARGGTIVSTEDVFRYLAPRLQPARILLAGIERGVLTHWPDGEIIAELNEIPTAATGSHAADVTGGMAAKIRETLAMVRAAPNCTALIFSGEEPELVKRALLGESVPGTVLR